MKRKWILCFPVLFLLISFIFTGCTNQSNSEYTQLSEFHVEDIPEYSGLPYVPVNRNIPYFTEEDLQNGKTSFEKYSKLDSLGRCGTAYASIGTDLMPTEERGSIGSIKPSGWQLVKYDFVDGKYLYNRCHLIAFQLAGENANPQNLITGTRYLNVEGMLPFENKTASYVKNTGNHVLYRVTPIFGENNLLSSGVLMEGMSVEDQGKGVRFCVYCYNVHPGVSINYQDGSSKREDTAPSSSLSSDSITDGYILNMKTLKFHRPTCSGVKDMKDTNKRTYTGSREELIAMGYEPCKLCNP